MDGTDAAPPVSDAFPVEAFELLAQSQRDSCAVCAERNRKRAFEALDAFYVPRLLIASGPERHFVLADSGTSELLISPYSLEDGRLTFRFHSEVDHLIGVEAADYTDEETVSVLGDLKAETSLQGTIEVIPYAYGDGPTYLYMPSENQVQVQCRVLEIGLE